MEVRFSERFLTALSLAETADPALAEALRDAMAKIRQAGDGCGTAAEFLARLERLGCAMEPAEEDD